MTLTTTADGLQVVFGAHTGDVAAIASEEAAVVRVPATILKFGAGAVEREPTGLAREVPGLREERAELAFRGRFGAALAEHTIFEG